MPAGRSGSRSRGVETGPAVLGPLWSGATAGYAAVGEVLEAAAALQSAAKAGSVLVGPATKLATDGIFDWGERRRSPLTPKRSPWWRFTWSGQRQGGTPTTTGGAGSGPLPSGRPQSEEISTLDEALRQATSGEGLCRFRGGGTGPGQDPSGAGMPEALHGLGRCRKGRFHCGWRAVVPRTPPRPLMASTSNSYPRGPGCPRGRRRGRTPGAGRAMRAVFGGEVEHTHLPGRHDGPA